MQKHMNENWVKNCTSEPDGAAAAVSFPTQNMWWTGDSTRVRAGRQGRTRLRTGPYRSDRADVTARCGGGAAHAEPGGAEAARSEKQERPAARPFGPAKAGGAGAGGRAGGRAWKLLSYAPARPTSRSKPAMHSTVPRSASMQRVTLCSAPTASTGLGKATGSRTAATTSATSCAHARQAQWEPRAARTAFSDPLPPADSRCSLSGRVQVRYGCLLSAAVGAERGRGELGGRR
jgi:hypothetical protein